MIERGVARYNWQTGEWEWESRRKNRDIECLAAASRRLGLSKTSARLLGHAMAKRLKNTFQGQGREGAEDAYAAWEKKMHGRMRILNKPAVRPIESPDSPFQRWSLIK